MRGSDYIVTGMVLANSHRQVSMEYMISTLREKLDNEGYEGIFLATEDSDILARMREAFPEKLRAVSQERYSVSDFTDVEYITDLDRKKHAESERERALDDITGNYMYALYTLSRCDLVMASGASSGFFFVRELSQSGIEPFILRQQE